MKYLKYSFLVPVYNVEKYLKQCIDSMLSQTYKDFEIVLVDDGSTDSSGKICDDYQALFPDIINVVHKKNEGLVSARQVGIEEAKGDIYLFVDSDDFVEPQLLYYVDREFSVHENLDMVIYSFQYYKGSQKSGRKSTISESDVVFSGDKKKELYSALMFTPLITSIWTKAVKREVFQKDVTDYKEHYSHNMGEDLFRSIFLLSLADYVKYINIPLYNYRTDNFSISRDFSPDSIEKKNMMYIYDTFIKYLPIWDMDNNETKTKLKLHWLELVVFTFNQYYIAADSYYQKKLVVDFNWDIMLPSDISTVLINDNNSVRTYKMIKDKKYLSLYIAFLKNTIYKELKRIKKRLL